MDGNSYIPKVYGRWHLRWVFLGPKQEGLKRLQANSHRQLLSPLLLSHGSNDCPLACLLAWVMIVQYL